MTGFKILVDREEWERLCGEYFSIFSAHSIFHIIVWAHGKNM